MHEDTNSCDTWKTMPRPTHITGGVFIGNLALRDKENHLAPQAQGGNR